MSARPRLVPVLSAAALVLALGACSSASADDAAGGSASGDASVCPDGRIRMGVEPFEDPAKLEPAFRVLGEALGEKLGCPVEVSIVEDYSAGVLAMENGELDVAVFGPLGYVFAERRADAQAVASFGLADGTLSSYTAGLWVPADSPIESVEDLAGHTLALGSTGSTSGDALPRFAIREAGRAEEDTDITYAGGHREALPALTNGTVDVAQINSQTQATAEREGTLDTSRFRQIWTSEPIPNDPVTVAGALGEEFRDAVQDALLSLDTEHVEQIGQYLDVDPAGPLVEVDKSTYQPLFDLADTLGLTEDDA
ncbi:phosphate/phosphite/phosphonate ABC transporter substrate-binding protein [Cellulomonas sp. GbtcB1]|uniref:phosphate/phosphite/phosphonate ABC transporter substrate-binding protein n=1 Tax=Cellulomonas sp. GbtcB1 TaxID=2824746 RepID=UPI001C2FB66E|nr:phosphate/phosphite/phosphonate ABC transporter substrate-binding protein [Cellulomonas sp. GbtcB1]